MDSSPEAEREAAPAVVSAEEWARRMRLAFSPRAMVRGDGSIDLNYFKPKLVADRWTDEERRRLVDGIGAVGIGRWDPLPMVPKDRHGCI